MTVIRIARPVKYMGVRYEANTDIVVKSEDVADLLSRGAWIISQEDEVNLEPNGEGDQDGEVEGGAQRPNNAGNPDLADDLSDEDRLKAQELAALKGRAAELGIEVKGNWGINKITKEIAEAEEALAEDEEN